MPCKFFAIVILVFYLGSMLQACSSETRIPQPNTPEAIMYKSNCNWCHSLPHPARHTKSQWEHLMWVMQEHRRDRKMPELAPKDYAIILGYLQKHAR